MNAQPAKTVFLDYDTVSTGDLDASELRAASGNLLLYDSDEALTAERIREVYPLDGMFESLEQQARAE